MGGQPGRHCPALKQVSGAQLGLRPKSPSPLSLQECCDAQQRPGNHSSQRGHLARPCPDTPSGKHAAGSVPGHPHGLDCPSLPGTSSGPSCHLCCPLEGLVLPSRAQPSRSWQPRSHPESTPPPTLDSSVSPSLAAAQGHPACPCSELPFPREMKVLSKVTRSFFRQGQLGGHGTNKTEGPPSSQKPDGTAWRSSPALWHLTQSPQASSEPSNS